MKNLILLAAILSTSVSQAGVVRDLVTAKIDTNEAVSQVIDSENVELAISEALKESVDLIADEEVGHLVTDAKLKEFSEKLLTAVEEENTSRSRWNVGKKVAGAAGGFVVGMSAAVVSQVVYDFTRKGERIPAWLYFGSLAAGTVGGYKLGDYLGEEFIEVDMSDLNL